MHHELCVNFFTYDVIQVDDPGFGCFLTNKKIEQSIFQKSIRLTNII